MRHQVQGPLLEHLIGRLLQQSQHVGQGPVASRPDPPPPVSQTPSSKLTAPSFVSCLRLPNPMYDPTSTLQALVRGCVCIPLSVPGRSGQAGSPMLPRFEAQAETGTSSCVIVASLAGSSCCCPSPDRFASSLAFAHLSWNSKRDLSGLQERPEIAKPDVQGCDCCRLLSYRCHHVAWLLHTWLQNIDSGSGSPTSTGLLPLLQFWAEGST